MNEDIEKEQAAEEFLNKYKNASEESSTESNVTPPIIQILFDQGIPRIQYANLTITEVVGALELSKQIIIQTNINTPILKNNIMSMVDALK